MHKNTMDSYAERLLESVLTSPSTSVTAFLLPEQVTLWGARSGPNSNSKPGSAPVPASSIIRSSCDRAAMCLGFFLLNRKVELESSRIWLAFVWTMSRAGQGDLQGKWKWGEELCYWETKVLHRWQMQEKLVVEPLPLQLRQKWLLFPTTPHIWMFKQSQTCLCGTLLSTRITKRQWPRRRVSATLDWSCSPTAPLPPGALS